jgi:peptidylprolyl isomerase/peptidyl-prolyl cis-trans isomerase B (cyclophilin B)
MTKTLALSAALAALFLAPGLQADETATAAVSPSAQVDKAPAKKAKTGAPKTATIELEKGGKIVFQFFPKEAPLTVANFVKLTDKGFYDGLTFHRVEPNFVIQGGDPAGNGSGGPGYTIKAEFNSHKHLRGTVAMARTNDPNSAGSQFYICLAPAPFLDNNYTVFGQLVSGDELLDGIKVGDKMKKVSIQR